MTRAAGSARTDRALHRVDAVRNRSKLLEAARQQLASGDTTLGLNALAKSAGVGVGTAYRHFPDRQSLVEGLAAEALAALVHEAHAAADGIDAAVGLERLLRAALTAMTNDPVLAEVLSAPTPVCAETVGLSRELGAAISDLLERARAVGAVREDLGPDDLRRLLAGVHAAARAGADTSAAQDRYLDVLLAGLRRPSARHA